MAKSQCKYGTYDQLRRCRLHIKYSGLCSCSMDQVWGSEGYCFPYIHIERAWIRSGGGRQKKKADDPFSGGSQFFFFAPPPGIAHHLSLLYLIPFLFISCSQGNKGKRYHIPNLDPERNTIKTRINGIWTTRIIIETILLWYKPYEIP